MLTARQQAIKKYIEKAHVKNRKPTIIEIANAFSISTNEVRNVLSAIRHDRKSNLFSSTFMEDLINLFGRK